MKSIPTHRRTLNQDQLTILATIYSYRFVTRSLLAQYLDRPNNTSLYSKLQILIKHGYLASHFSKQYRLAGREAEYYITPTGLRALRDSDTLAVTDAMLTAVYKDKTVSLDFIEQVTTIMRVRNRLHDAHQQLQAFTTRDLQALDYFPSPRPSLFLSIKHETAIKRFFLEYIPASALDSRSKKQLQAYTAYYEEDAWDVTGTPFPGILFITDSSLKERTLRSQIEREKYRSDTDISYYTTTLKAVLSLTPSNTEIWTDSAEPGELLSLTDL